MDLEAFKAKLQKNMQHSHNGLEVPEEQRQWAYDELRDSSVELQVELDLDITHELENFDRKSTTN